jgi:hypothetical protein
MSTSFLSKPYKCFTSCPWEIIASIQTGGRCLEPCRRSSLGTQIILLGFICLNIKQLLPFKSLPHRKSRLINLNFCFVFEIRRIWLYAWMLFWEFSFFSSVYPDKWWDSTSDHFNSNTFQLVIFQFFTATSVKIRAISSRWDGGSKHLWNVSKLLPDYTAQKPRRQPSSFPIEHSHLASHSVYYMTYAVEKPWLINQENTQLLFMSIT